MKKSNWNRRIKMSKWTLEKTFSLTSKRMKAIMSRLKRLSRMKKEQGKTTTHPSTMSTR